MTALAAGLLKLSLIEGVRCCELGVCGCWLLAVLLMFERLNFKFSLGLGGGGSMIVV